MEGGPFSKWGSRLGAADIRLKSLQQLHGWRADGFQNGALAFGRYSLSTDLKAQWFDQPRICEVTFLRAHTSSSMSGPWGACQANGPPVFQGRASRCEREYLYGLMRRGHGTGGCTAASLMHPGFSLVLLLLLLLHHPAQTGGPKSALGPVRGRVWTRISRRIQPW